MHKNKTLKRGAFRRDDCVFIGAWVPEAWVGKIDEVVTTEDTDRSKFLRSALREKLSLTRAGIPIKEAA